MYSRFLFVGLGGSGGKTLRFLKREIKQWQNRHRIDGPVPSGWQFLHIDTPPVADGNEIDDIVERLPSDEYLGLIPAGLGFHSVQQTLDGQRDLYEVLATWRVNPPGVNVGLAMGAGQFRAIGHTVAMAFASTIRKRLQASQARLNSHDAEFQIAEAYHKATGETPDGKSNVYIVVISSLAGGTGAGLLNLVCDILRAERTSAGDNIFGILYTPEVFHSLNAAEIGGVQPNSLAAVCEMMNGNWWGGNPVEGSDLFVNVSAIRDPVLESAGLPRAITRSGPSYPFLVGRVGSGGIDHGTPDRLFEITGRSLLSWVTDRKVQARFIAYTSGNWQSSAMSNSMGRILVDEGGSHDKGYPQFSALGFARVSVGSDYFERYIVQRLVREANEHIVDYHHSSVEAKRVAKRLQTNDPDEISEGMAKEMVDFFLREAHLSEEGPEENQIIDALVPDNENALYSHFEQRAISLAGIDDPGIKKSIGAWEDDICYAVGEAQREYSNNYRSVLDDSTRKWAEEIQEHVVSAVEDYISRVGLRVTGFVCRQAAKLLRHSTYDDLMNREVKKNDRWAGEWKRHTRERLAGIRGSVESTHPDLGEAVKDGVHYAHFVVDSHRAARAAELCQEISEKLLIPLSAAILDADAVAAGDKPSVRTFPAWTDKAPPRSLHPPSGEFTLIRAEDYPREFSELLKQTTNGKSGTARQTVRRAVITGDFLKKTGNISDSEVNDLRCVHIRHDWWPSIRALVDPDRNPARVDVEVRTSLIGLKRRANKWLLRQGSPFANFLGLSVRSFLGSDSAYRAIDFSPTQLATNQTRFLALMSSAIDASAPLVSLDQDLMGRVHPRSIGQPHKRYFSQIPLQGHTVEQKLRGRLVEAGMNDAEINELLTNDASVDHIDIISSLHSPHSVLVMQSLLRPISESWHKAGSKREFWTRRRARTLERFIPVPQSLLVCMIRGWFTGVLLGRIDRGSRNDPCIRVMRSNGGRAAEFPYPFLTPARNERDKLAQVLEMLGLAYVEVGRKSSLEPLAPFIELRELGRSMPDSDLFTYDTLNGYLHDWVSTGSLETGIAAPHSLLTKIRGDSDRRAEGLAENLDKVMAAYQKRYDEQLKKWRLNQTNISRAPLWIGLWRPMRQALSQIAEACLAVEDEHGEDLL